MPSVRYDFLQSLPIDQYASFTLSSGERCPLHNDAEIYLLSEGTADAFLIRSSKGNKELADRPLFVGKAEQGEVLLSFPTHLISTHAQFILLAEENCLIHRIPNSEIQKCLLENEAAWKSFDDALNQWMEKICHQLHLRSEQANAIWNRVQNAPLDLQNSQRELLRSWNKEPKDTPIQLKAGTELYAGFHSENIRQRVCWVKVHSGRLTVCGRKELTIDPSSETYPMSFPLVFEAREPCSITLSHAPETLYSGFVGWTLFCTHYRHLLLTEAMDTRIETENEVLGQIIRDRLAVDHSLRRFGHIMEGTEYLEPVHSREALKTVCEQIGERLGLSFAFPRDFEQYKSTEERLHQLCWRSEIRYSRMPLSKDWELHQHGPLLAFYKESKTPVLLAKDDQKHYSILDPITGERRPVDEESAAELDTCAYRFYREIPAEKTGSAFKTLMHLASDPIRRSLLYRSLWNILLTSVAGACIPIAIQLIFDKSIPNRDFPLLMQIFLATVVIIVSRGAFQLVSSLALLRLQGLMTQSLTCGVWSRLLRLAPTFYRTMSTGAILTRMDAADEMIMRLGSMLPTILTAMAAVVYPALMIYYSPLLAAYAVSLAIPVLIIALLTFRYISEQVLAEQEKEAGIHSFVIQTMLGIPKIRSTASENRIFSRWASAYSDLQEVSFNIMMSEALLKVLARVLPTFVMGSSLLILSLTPSIRESMSFGSVTGFLAATGMFWGQITMLLAMLGEFAKIAVPWRRLQPILTEPPEYHSDHLATHLSGEIELRNVWFRYTNIGQPILKNVSFRINGGDFVGFAGRSGCGKTTLIRLLTGFEHPTDGKVFFDGVNLHELNLPSVRSQMGVVMQDASLTVSSIREFLQMGGAQTEEEMWWALDFAGLRKEVENLAMGMETLITDQEGVFSTGQRQRLLIARALIGHPRILIFDEATTALDDVSQQHVMDILESLSITRIVITHRLDSLKKADQIFVFDRGEIVDSGTYDQLVQREGVFGDMIHRNGNGQPSETD